MSDPTRAVFEREGEVVLARLSGEVEISGIETLRAELVSNVENRDHGLVVDLSHATYVDSAGVNMLFELAEALARRQIRMAVVVPEEGLVARVVSLVGMDSAIPVRATGEAAVAVLRSPPEGY
ncbi:MAG: STAS domain-containing protein [Thermoleophilaceae bacterium]